MHIPPRIPVHHPWPVKDTQDQICSGNQCPQLHQLTHDSFLVTVGCNHQCVWCCILASMMNSLQFWESNHWRSQHWRKHRGKSFSSKVDCLLNTATALMSCTMISVPVVTLTTPAGYPTPRKCSGARSIGTINLCIWKWNSVIGSVTLKGIKIYEGLLATIPTRPSSII